MSDFQFITIKLNNHKPPVYSYNKDSLWIQYGKERPFVNNYPAYLDSLFERANLHSAFLKAKAYYISGNGITIDKSALTVGDSSALLAELEEANQYGESIMDVLNKCVLDYVIQGGCYIEVNWSMNGKRFEVTHMPYNSLRRSSDEKGYFYSNDWTKSKDQQTFENTGFEFIPNIDFEKRKGRQIYALKSYSINCKYYPKPEYLALVPCAEVEYEIANYHLNSIKSGFHLGTIISFVGKPKPEEQDAIETQLKEKFQGTDAAGSLLLQFTRDKDGAPTITRLSPDELSEKFVTLTKWIDQQLTAGHHMSPILAGIKAEGQLGSSRSEIDLAHELFKNTWVKPNQKVIERWINKLYDVYGFADRIKLKEARPLNPFDFKDIMSYLDANEIRELAGFEKKKITNESKQRFKKEIGEDEVFNAFIGFGEDSDLFEVLESKEMTPEDWQKFAKKPTELQSNILAILSKDSLATDAAIAEALKMSERKIASEIEAMEKDELIDSSEKNQEGVKIRKIKVTPDGRDIAKDSELWEKEIRYSYEWRTEIPTSQRDTKKHPSRPFCHKLMGMNKYFTRTEIDSISSKVGLNVWEFRGGWWNDDGYNSPSCRHIWKSVLVKRK